jgi:lysozyme family protein
MATTKRKAVAPKPAVRSPRPDLFKEALKHVLVHEGGKANHPKDPGGRTNKGITQRVYNGWRDKNHLPARDVFLISDAEVESIYRFQYWDPIKGDQLPRGVGYVVFDGAVNSGVGQSVKWLQRALGFEKAAVDGMLGSITLSAAQGTADQDLLIGRIIDRRETFLRALKTWPTFGKGWMSRITQVEQTGQAWATGVVGADPTPVLGGEQKALVEDAKKAPGKGYGDVASGGGVGAGGIGALVQGLQDQLTPFSMAGDWIGTLVVILIITGAVLTVGGLAYRWWAGRKKAALSDALDLQPVT